MGGKNVDSRRDVFLEPVSDNIETIKDSYTPNNKTKRSILKHHIKPSLPPDWACYRSISYPDRVYFFNKKTNQSTWDDAQEISTIAKVKKVVSFNPNVKCQYIDAEDPLKSQVVVENMCAKHVGEKEQDQSSSCGVSSGISSEQVTNIKCIPAPTVFTPQQSQQPARNSTVRQPAVVPSVAQSLLSQPALSLASTGQTSGQIGLGLGTAGQGVAHIGQSVVQSKQNNSKPVSSVAQQSLKAPSLPHLSAGQSVGVPVNNFPKTSCQTTLATTLNTYPISFSHPVNSGTTVVSQVENNYGLVATGVALGTEGALNGNGVGALSTSREGALTCSSEGALNSSREDSAVNRSIRHKTEDNSSRHMNHSWSRQPKFFIKDLVMSHDGYHKCHFCNKEYNVSLSKKIIALKFCHPLSLRIEVTVRNMFLLST